MKLDKNLILAAGLSLLVIVVFTILFPPMQQQPSDTTMANATSVSASEPAGLAKEQPAQDTAKHSAAAPAHGNGFMPAENKDINIETDLISAVISTQGGVIRSWKLKAYNDDKGVPVEMVQGVGDVLPALVIPESVNMAEASAIPYSADADSLDLTGKSLPGSLTLTARDSAGNTIEKKFKFDNTSYGFDIEVRTEGYGGFALASGESFGSMTGADDKVYGHVGFCAMSDGEIISEKHKSIEGPFMPVDASLGWAGVTDQYFLAAIVPYGAMRAKLIPGESDWGYVTVSDIEESGAGASGRYKFYAGPKEYDDLKTVGYGLDQSVDFGWFAFIAKPLFYVLKYFYGLVGNYGWAIIILTVIIKVVFAPLTHKQQKSMKRMQKLQPLINELKEKFKGEPQKMNAEMMELYKKHKVNPLGGCLPMVIQLPVFIALYKVLYTAIELRQAPFMWWLTDLSAKDPYYILPVLMGVSMFLMQKMTPTTVEGPQAMVFKFMPVIMVAIFINLPSGLLLYFTISNLLQMAQQFYINRYSADEA